MIMEKYILNHGTKYNAHFADRKTIRNILHSIYLSPVNLTNHKQMLQTLQ